MVSIEKTLLYSIHLFCTCYVLLQTPFVNTINMLKPQTGQLKYDLFKEMIMIRNC